MKISDCIVELQAILDEKGDLDMFISTDDEGNEYGELNTDDISYNSSCVCLYPGYPCTDELPEEGQED